MLCITECEASNRLITPFNISCEIYIYILYISNVILKQSELESLASTLQSLMDHLAKDKLTLISTNKQGRCFIIIIL